MRKIISSNFKVRKEGDFDRIPIIVKIIVDRNSKATFDEIIKSTDNIYEIISKEIEEGQSWFNIRNQEPCCNCV